MPLFETTQQAAQFLGWCTILNMGMLIFATIMIVALREPVSRFHGRLFQMEADQLQLTYFNYLGNYKLLTLVFNLMPYVALKIVG